MAIMADGDRATVHREVMQKLSRINEACGVTKGDLRAAVNAADQWVSDNAASFNSALPLPARTALTASQKARLLLMVIAKRFNGGV